MSKFLYLTGRNVKLFQRQRNVFRFNDYSYYTSRALRDIFEQSV